MNANAEKSAIHDLIETNSVRATNQGEKGNDDQESTQRIVGSNDAGGVFTFLFGMAPQVTAAEMTKKQAQTLAATAKTPADHMKLAAYVKLEANRLDAQATAQSLRDAANSTRELAAQHEQMATGAST